MLIHMVHWLRRGGHQLLLAKVKNADWQDWYISSYLFLIHSQGKQFVPLYNLHGYVCVETITDKVNKKQTILVCLLALFQWYRVWTLCNGHEAAESGISWA